MSANYAFRLSARASEKRVMPDGAAFFSQRLFWFFARAFRVQGRVAFRRRGRERRERNFALFSRVRDTVEGGAKITCRAGRIWPRYCV